MIKANVEYPNVPDLSASLRRRLLTRHKPITEKPKEVAPPHLSPFVASCAELRLFYHPGVCWLCETSQHLGGSPMSALGQSRRFRNVRGMSA